MSSEDDIYGINLRMIWLSFRPQSGAA